MIENAQWAALVHGGWILGLSLVLLFLAKLAYGMASRRNVASDLTVADNHAAAIELTAYTLGVGAVVASAAQGESVGFAKDAENLALYGIVGILLTLCATLIQGRIFCRAMPGHSAVNGARNIAVALARGSWVVASGVILAGILSGQGGGLVAVPIYALLGQGVLGCVGLIYRRACGYDVIGEIAQGNVAAGISYAGNTLASGIILFHAGRGESMGWARDLTLYALHAALGLVLIPVLRWLFDMLWVPGVRVRDEVIHDKNWGLVLLEATLLQVLALLFVVSFG